MHSTFPYRASLTIYLTPKPSDVDFSVYLDQRGQGRSGRVPIESCTIEQMADDAAALCRALGIERPAVLGHSFGGFVALHLALRRPSRVLYIGEDLGGR